MAIVSSSSSAPRQERRKETHDSESTCGALGNTQAWLGAGQRSAPDSSAARNRTGGPGRAQRSEPRYLSQIESGVWTGITEDVLGRIAKALGVEPWVILAQAAGLKLDQVERFSDDERRWLDAFRALDPEQRETVLKVAMVMRRPSPQRRKG